MTALMRVSSHAVTGASILDSDFVVVDRSLEPRPGHVVVAVAVVAGEMTLKRLRWTKAGRLALVAENPDCPAAAIREDDGAEVWNEACWPASSASSPEPSPWASRG